MTKSSNHWKNRSAKVPTIGTFLTLDFQGLELLDDHPVIGLAFGVLGQFRVVFCDRVIRDARHPGLADDDAMTFAEEYHRATKISFSSLECWMLNVECWTLPAAGGPPSSSPSPASSPPRTPTPRSRTSPSAATFADSAGRDLNSR